MPSHPTAFERDVATGQRFEFGQNWRRFLSVLNEDRIANAIQSFQQQLGLERLDGLRFCDAGSGSGLFSLAARRLGATVHSFDFDPSSVGCTQELKRRYFADDPHWTIQQASVLDQDYLKSLGQFDVVYSWGVLHHTGAMWQAIENVTTLVVPNGRLFIALYNDQGFLSRMWLAVKRAYCCCTLGRWAMTAIWVPGFFARMCVASLDGGRNKFAAYHHERGMSPVHDWIDWIGGLPFEVAKPDDVIRFHEQRGFELLKLTPTRSLGCNQFVFQLKRSLRDESTQNMSYRVEHADSKRASFGVYRYCIYQGDRLIAHYWHDHRGDEHGIEFVNGLSEDCPVGRMTDFLEGGGPEPLRLSDNATAYLTRKQHEKS